MNTADDIFNGIVNIVITTEFMLGFKKFLYRNSRKMRLMRFSCFRYDDWSAVKSTSGEENEYDYSVVCRRGVGRRRIGAVVALSVPESRLSVVVVPGPGTAGHNVRNTGQDFGIRRFRFQPRWKDGRGGPGRRLGRSRTSALPGTLICVRNSFTSIFIVYRRGM